jgi:hypothetical protein
MQTRSPARPALRLSELSVPRQRLIRLCQTINYGSIRGLEVLEVKEGLPVFDPPPILLMDIKLDGDNAARPEVELRDFALRDEALQLMDHLDRLVTTRIECLEVHAGNPRRLILRVSSLEAVTLRSLI